MENQKKTLGRRKIEIKKIDKKTNLQVTFAKRHRGLFRKASELAILCGAQVAVVVQSPAKKVLTFSHPPSFVESLVSTPSAPRIIRHGDDGRSSYEAAIKMLEAEKGRIDGGGFWWEKPFEGLELRELEDFLAALEDLRDNVAGRLEKFESSTTNSAAVVPVQEFSGAAYSAAAAPVQDFSGAAYSAAAAPVQDFSGAAYSAAAAPVQEFSGAAYSATATSVQEFSGAAYSATATSVPDFSGASYSAATSVQEFSGAAYSTASSVQELAASASDSSCQDQDLFDDLDLSYLLQPSDQEHDFPELFN